MARVYPTFNEVKKLSDRFNSGRRVVYAYEGHDDSRCLQRMPSFFLEYHMQDEGGKVEQYRLFFTTRWFCNVWYEKFRELYRRQNDGQEPGYPWKQTKQE